MATLYPNQIDGTAQLPNVSGTFTLDGTVGGADHALVTTNINTAAIALENVLGTTAGTSVISSFLAGQTALPIQSGTLGTTIAKGTINASVFGTPAITGGTYNNGVFGTPSLIGGTHNNVVMGTPQINGGTVGSTTVLNTLQSAFFYYGSSTLSGATIPFANQVLDQLGEYNGTQFVAKQAGIYEFYSQLYTGGNGADFNIQIVLNGTVQTTVRCNPNGFGLPTMWLGSVPVGGTVLVNNLSGTGAIGTNSYFFGKRLY